MGGLRGETRCLHCLHPDCTRKAQTRQLRTTADEDKREEYCNICWVEGLGQAPSLHLKCGHIFHYNCIREKLQRRWPGARITFSFLNCPLCNGEISHKAVR